MRTCTVGFDKIYSCRVYFALCVEFLQHSFLKITAGIGYSFIFVAIAVCEDMCYLLKSAMIISKLMLYSILKRIARSQGEVNVKLLRNANSCKNFGIFVFNLGIYTMYLA